MIERIVAILVACVLLLHLGLGEAIIKIVRKRIVLLECPKCLTFWAELAYMLTQRHNIIDAITVSAGCAYAAVWLQFILEKIMLLIDDGEDNQKSAD